MGLMAYLFVFIIIMVILVLVLPPNILHVLFGFVDKIAVAIGKLLLAKTFNAIN